jgi:hypothetical protein
LTFYASQEAPVRANGPARTRILRLAAPRDNNLIATIGGFFKIGQIEPGQCAALSAGVIARMNLAPCGPYHREFQNFMVVTTNNRRL